MATDRVEFNEFRLGRYNKYWEHLENGDHGQSISNPLEYLLRFDNDIRSDQYSDVVKIEQTTSRHSLTRFYPYNGQPILLALEEPRLDDFETNERVQLAQSSGDPAEMAEISVNYYSDYLAGNGHDTAFNTEILDKFIQSDSPVGPDDDNEKIEYLYPNDGDNQKYADRIERNISTTSGIWEDFYVTNTFSLDEFSSFTYDDKNANKKQHKVEFFKEAQKSGAKILILSGSTAWNAIRSGINKERGAVENELSLIAYPDESPPCDMANSNISDVKGHLYEDTEGVFYIPVPHIGGPTDRLWEDGLLEEAIREVTSRVWK